MTPSSFAGSTLILPRRQDLGPKREGPLCHKGGDPRLGSQVQPRSLNFARRSMWPETFLRYEIFLVAPAFSRNVLEGFFGKELAYRNKRN